MTSVRYDATWTSPLTESAEDWFERLAAKARELGRDIEGITGLWSARASGEDFRQWYVAWG